jgi:hypothetical protein
MEPGYSTKTGFVNLKGQVVIRKTEMDGNDHMQKVYQIACSNCGAVYGANGSDLHLRKCPECQSGQPGLEYK